MTTGKNRSPERSHCLMWQKTSLKDWDLGRAHCLVCQNTCATDRDQRRDHSRVLQILEEVPNRELNHS